jgi:hypothetical protein
MKFEVPLERETFESVAFGDLIAALRAAPSRIAMRLFNEANSELAYLHRHSHVLSDTEVMDQMMFAQFPNNGSSKKETNIGINIMPYRLEDETHGQVDQSLSYLNVQVSYRTSTLLVNPRTGFATISTNATIATVAERGGETKWRSRVEYSLTRK